MSKTDTNVIISEYRAQFRAEPFGRPRWRVTGGLQYRTTLQRRRRATVAAEYGRTTEPAVGHLGGVLVDQDAVLMFLPDAPASRYGTAVVIEQVAR